MEFDTYLSPLRIRAVPDLVFANPTGAGFAGFIIANPAGAGFQA